MWHATRITAKLIFNIGYLDYVHKKLKSFQRAENRQQKELLQHLMDAKMFRV